MKNRQFLIVERPGGFVAENNFRYNETEVPELKDGQFLVEANYISIDPSLRVQMDNLADYAEPLELGDVMHAYACGTVIQSRNPDYPVGARTFGDHRMQQYAVRDSSNQLQIFDPGFDPVDMMSIYGGTGLTAYFGMTEIGKPKPGDTVVVSGAAGGTGSIAGQIAKIMGARVIGLAGSDEKCRLLKKIGFDEAINYKTESVPDRLDALCPDGINVYYDNVGGDILDWCLERLAYHARIVLCGGISQYNAKGEMKGPKNYFNLVFSRSRMEGFIVLQYIERFGEAIAQLKQWKDAGKLVSQVHVVEGFENLPKALVGMFKGENTGKTMVKV